MVVSDEVIARSFGADHAEALGLVYDRYGAVLFGYLRGVINDVGRAEDVFQQVMTEIWARRAQFDPNRASLLTWMMTIARSRAIDELRRQRRAPSEVELDGVGAIADAEADDLVERWRIADLLDRLPSDERDVLRLRFYDRMTQVEIAERTATPLGTVKSQMIRALTRLRSLLEAEMEPSGATAGSVHGSPASGGRA